MNCSGACTVKLDSTPTNGYYGAIESIGSTVATLSLNGLTLNGLSIAPTLITNQVIFFWSDGTNYFGGANFAGTTTTGQLGGFWLPSATTPPLSLTTVSVANSNTSYFVGFYLPFPALSTKMILRITGGVASSTGDFGIYTSAGAKLATIGGFSTASSDSTIPTPRSLASSAVLMPGFYLFAFCDTSTSVTFSGSTSFPGGILAAQTGPSSTVGAGTGANSCVAGVLPSSLGSLTAAANTSVPYAYVIP